MSAVSLEWTLGCEAPAQNQGAQRRRASSCWKHAFGMTRPHAAAIWLRWAHRVDVIRNWLP